MRPYPWNQRKRFTSHTQLGWLLHYTVVPLLVLGTLAFPLAAPLAIFCARRFHTLNDRWPKRGLFIIAVAVVLSPVFGTSPKSVGQAFLDLMYSFGDRATMTTSDAVQQWFTTAAPIGLLLTGLAVLAHAYEYEFAAQRFLNPTRPTLLMRLRRRRNAKTLRGGDAKPDRFMKFGVIVDDPIPWRTPRFGMIVERPMDGLGHGCITGASGSGKTVLASNMAHGAAANDQAVVYVDCKASVKTLNAIRAVADHADVPFTSFDVGVSANASRWYDPLDYNGSASEKSSMLIEAFDLPSEGPSAFYRSAAEAWLPLQFEVMEWIGLAPGEGRFDFLVATSSPQGLKDRLAAARTSDPQRDAQIDEWIRQTQGVKADTLTNLKNNLTKIVTTGGDRLRPPADGTPPLSFADVAERGGIAYIGLSAATDATALKVLGSLVIRDLTALSGIRARHLAPDARRVLALVDEASRLGSRATVLEDLFATARESLIDVWPITQSFSTWPESTRKEMVTNASTQVAFRVQDAETAESLTSSLGETPALSEMTQESIEHRAFRDQSISAEGDGRSQLMFQPHLRPDALLSIEDRHAFIWFSGTRTYATKRRWKSRRVRKDAIKRDAPLVEIVPVALVLPENSAVAETAVAAAPDGAAAPYATHDFGELVAGFQTATATGDPLRPDAVEPPGPAVAPVPAPRPRAGSDAWMDTEHLPADEPPVEEHPAGPPEPEGAVGEGWDADAPPLSPWTIQDGSGGATPPPLSDEELQRIEEFKAHAAPAEPTASAAPPAAVEAEAPAVQPAPSSPSRPPSVEPAPAQTAQAGGWGDTDYLAPEPTTPPPATQEPAEEVDPWSHDQATDDQSAAPQQSTEPAGPTSSTSSSVDQKVPSPDLPVEPTATEPPAAAGGDDSDEWDDGSDEEAGAAVAAASADESDLPAWAVPADANPSHDAPVSRPKSSDRSDQDDDGWDSVDDGWA